MEKNIIISPVPIDTLDFNDQTGLKNLAGWIARYKKLGVLYQNGFSPTVRELLENGSLAKFEPSLTGYEGGQEASDEEYYRYEFTVQTSNLVELSNGCADLGFSFVLGKCIMYPIVSENKYVEAIEHVLNSIGHSLLVNDLTWKEADEIILKCLKYINNPEIPFVPAQ